MSDRTSGQPGVTRRAARLFLVLVPAIALALGAMPAGPASPGPARAATGPEVSTPFPAVVAEPGSTASFDLRIRVPSAQRVDLAVEGVPDGWTARFRGGGLVVDGAFVEPGESPEVTLDVEIPEDAPAGTATLAVTATGTEGSDRLEIDVRVAEAAAGDVTLTSDFPELRGASTATFSFTLSLRNDTAAEATFAIDARGPEGWTVSAEPAGQSQATSTVVKAGSSSSITVRAEPGRDVAAGSYPIRVAVSGAGKTASTDLTVTITGTYELAVSTPDQVLSTTATAGSTRDFPVRLANQGTAPLTAVTLSASAPTGWTVAFEPETVASIEPGASADVTARITPSGDAIAGDYSLRLTGSAEEASGEASIRVRVETPAFWWIVGVALLVAVGAGLYWVFRTYGRR